MFGVRYHAVNVKARVGKGFISVAKVSARVASPALCAKAAAPVSAEMECAACVASLSAIVAGGERAASFSIALGESAAAIVATLIVRGLGDASSYYPLEDHTK